MTKKNPSNPFSNDDARTKRDVPPPLAKARVTSAIGSADGGFHTVTVSIYGDDSPQQAMVLPTSIGSVHVPKSGQDVAVLFASNEKPWVIAPWYAVNRVQNGEIDLPDYEPGEHVLGNDTGAEVRIDNNGDIHLNSGPNGSVYIDGVKQ